MNSTIGIIVWMDRLLIYRHRFESLDISISFLNDYGRFQVWLSCQVNKFSLLGLAIWSVYLTWLSQLYLLLDTRKGQLEECTVLWICAHRIKEWIPSEKFPKGQLISECLFDFFKFSKKPTKNLTNFCPWSKKWSNYKIKVLQYIK